MFGTFDRALTSAPAVIVGRKGAAGAVHYSPDPCWPIDTAFYAEGSKATFLPFFRYLLESLHLVALDRSTAIPSLSRDDYNSKIAHYPESLDEQRRIVAEIEQQFTRLEAGVAALKRAQANLKRYRAAVLKSACEGRLVPTEAERWQDSTLEELLRSNDIFNDGDWVESKDQDPDGEVRLVQLADVGDGVFRNRSNRFLTKAKAVELGCTFLKSGDVLVARMPDPLGRACIFPEIDRECVTVVDVCVIRATDHHFDRHWLMHTINATDVRSQISWLQAGSTRKRISRKNLATIRLRVPPLAEQKRIVAEVERRLSVVEGLEAMVSANLQRATRLRQSILQCAFTGKLTRGTVLR